MSRRRTLLIKCHVSCIVTANLEDFPTAALAPYAMMAQAPDGFVRDLLRAQPDAALVAFAADRARLRNPAMSPADYLASLRGAGLTETAGALETVADML